MIFAVLCSVWLLWISLFIKSAFMVVRFRKCREVSNREFMVWDVKLYALFACLHFSLSKNLLTLAVQLSEFVWGCLHNAK